MFLFVAVKKKKTATTFNCLEGAHISQAFAHCLFYTVSGILHPPVLRPAVFLVADGTRKLNHMLGYRKKQSSCASCQTHFSNICGCTSVLGQRVAV